MSTLDVQSVVTCMTLSAPIGGTLLARLFQLGRWTRSLAQGQIRRKRQRGCCGIGWVWAPTWTRFGVLVLLGWTPVCSFKGGPARCVSTLLRFTYIHTYLCIYNLLSFLLLRGRVHYLPCLASMITPET